MHFKISILFFIFICFSSGCTRVPDQLKIAERMMDTNPDSVLIILNHLKKPDYQTSPDRALIGLLLFNALERSDKKIQPVSVIDYSIEYFKSKNDQLHLARCYFLKGHMFKHANRYDEAAALDMKALDCLEHTKDNTLSGRIYEDMGDIYCLESEYKESIKKYRISHNYFKNAGKQTEANQVILSIGRQYNCLRKYKTALQYYNYLLSQNNDSILTGAIYQELGVYYYTTKQFDQAQYYLKKSLLYPYRSTNYSIRSFVLADVLFEKALYDSSFQYATEALNYPANFYTQRDCYRILVNIQYTRKKFSQMGFYMGHYQDCVDSIRKIQAQTKLSAIENIHNTTREADIIKLNMVLIVSALIIILLLSTLLVFYLYKRNKLKRVQLNAFKLQLNNKQEFVSKGILKKIEDIKALKADERKNASADERIKLDKELYHNALRLDNWDDFSREMNHAFNNLVVTLIADYPAISQKEIIWCCLHLLDIPHADRMILLDASSDSLYKLKQRFAHKLNLKSTKDLDLFLRDLIEIKE